MPPFLISSVVVPACAAWKRHGCKAQQFSFAERRRIGTKAMRRSPASSLRVSACGLHARKRLGRAWVEG